MCGRRLAGAEVNNPALVKRLMAQLPASEAIVARQLEIVTGNPSLALKNMRSTCSSVPTVGLAIFRVYRVARTDVDLALEYWRPMAGKLSDGDRQ